MGFLSALRGIYSLDTLDTRFTTPSTVSYSTAVEQRTDRNGKREVYNKPDKRAQPPKWKTPEFFLYYLVFVVAVPYMFWVAYDVSRPSDTRYSKYAHYLSPGWIPGRQIDVSDAQYHTFRSNLPYMVGLLSIHPLLRRAWNAVFPLPSTTNGSPRLTGPEAADARLNQRISFDYTFALLFLVILHGFSAIKVLIILYINYRIATGLPKRYVPVATWVFNIGTLFANELFEGYKFHDIATLFSSTPKIDLVSDQAALIRFGNWLDSYGGLMSRWEILFNITILRLISFNLDYYWSLDRRSGSPIEKQLDPANLSERDRVTIPPPPSDFSFRNYLAYAVYAPLYLTGPILTFNDYIAQARYRPSSIETARTVRYGIRFALVLLAMEVILHYDYVGAISKANPDWSSYTPAQLSLLSYFNLHLIWLKLLIPWRLFRLWALIDGVDPPENMIRCMSDNYSTAQFWRAWHRSYNKWLIRYIYVPLGGADFRTWRKGVRSVVNYLLTFTFVALWHDIRLRLLIWGWLVVFFMLPEVAGRMAFPARKWEARPTAYRMISCVGAVGNVLMMMAANLVGFAVGLDGLESILKGIFHDFSGVLFLLAACSALFVGIQIMFEIRESELRKGINLKC
ncbi:Glycerol uptake protein 1 [Coniochaeta hoffmannii]|uniref:Glycerol uptake protein 1 n=1 Tax=Coniochaeta hoffmannii TaxID=91930 RepID=A0AA38RSG6_9PEZI|nr:Glycerol uptake protein 1 [Coniochaeta hoffmannii]